MSRYNTKTAAAVATSPVKAESVPSGRTYEGAPGHARDARSELFLLAVSHLGDGAFYETAAARNSRFSQLVGQVAGEDQAWIRGFIPWLRDEAGMRTVSVLAAAEAARAFLAAGKPGGRQLVAATLRRADEPGELLAYWHATHGRVLPKPVKRGLADAVSRLYDEFALLRYDTASHAYRFGDVIELTHPSPRAGGQGDLFRHAIDRRHGHDNVIQLAPGPMVAAQQLLRTQAARNPDVLLDTGRLREAGMTWEDALSLAGDRVDKARLWAALIPVMGMFALIRNLRNFDQAGVPDEVAQQAGARIADREQIRKSRIFPFRFVAAYRAAPSVRWAWPLEQAVGHSLENVPALTGRTLVLVDRSGSMFSPMSGKSSLRQADAAALFGAALAVRSQHADLVQFGTSSERVEVRPGTSLLKIVEQFRDLGGTNTADAVRSHFAGHDRVVIVTDEQAWGGYRGESPLDQVPASVPVYTWNLAGYRYGHGESGTGSRHAFGGLSDASFRLIPLIEACQDSWPWEQA